eukprot:301525_1
MGNSAKFKTKPEENSELYCDFENITCIDIGSCIDLSKYTLKAIKTNKENVAVLMKEWSSAKNNIFSYWNCINPQNDSIIISNNFKPSTLYLEHKFENIIVNITEDVKYIIIFVEFGRLIKFIPISTLIKYLNKNIKDDENKENNSIDITNKGIDITGKEFIHSLPEAHGKLCTKYLGNNEFVIGYSPKQDLNQTEWPIDFYIYSCENGQLINKIINKVTIPNYNKQKDVGYVHITSLKNIQINNNIISFWNNCQTQKFIFDKKGKMSIIKHIDNEIVLRGKSACGKYECYCKTNVIYMKCLERENVIIGKWKLQINEKKINEDFVAVCWYSNNIFIGYNANKLYVFRNAILNVNKRNILKYFGFGNMINIILEMIGFELYGIWIVSQMDMNELDTTKIRCLQRDYALSAYYGIDKQYAIITEKKNGLKHIIVDLDKKYIVTEKVEFILD